MQHTYNENLHKAKFIKIKVATKLLNLLKYNKLSYLYRVFFNIKQNLMATF